MLFVVGVALYIAVGHFLAAVTVGRGDVEDPGSVASGLGYLVLWWSLWPLGLLLMLAGRAGLAAGRALPGTRPSDLTVHDRIDELERSLGMHQADPGSPRAFPALQGTSAEACLLPRMSDHEFTEHYGFPGSPQEATLRRLEAAIGQLEQVGQVPARLASDGPVVTGPQLLDAAEAALRRIGRLEETIEPLFAGLEYPSYGQVRAACIQARGRIGDILDCAALAGDLQPWTD